MQRFSGAIALLCTVIAAVTAVLLSVEAGRARNGFLLLLGAVTSLQAISLTLVALRRPVLPGLLATMAIWCILSGMFLPLAVLNYAHHHGAEGLIEAAGVSGFVDAEGQFYSSTPPVRQTDLLRVLVFAGGQVGSAFVSWKGCRG